MIRRVPALVVSCVLGSLSTGHAIKFSVKQMPKVNITSPNVPSSFKSDIETEMNTSLATSLQTTVDQANTDLAHFNNQKDLAQGFGNANAYSMHSATLQGYQNYSLFAIGSGLMFGVQAPSLDPQYLQEVGGEIEEKGDLYAGVAVGGAFFNLGINAGFVVPGLYLNLKYGGMEQEIDDFSMKFSTWGIGANFRLFDQKSAMGLVKWRGVSVGSGFYGQSNEIGISIKPDTLKSSIPFRDAVVGSTSDPVEQTAYGLAMDDLGYTAANPDADLALSPQFKMGLEVSTYTVPLDVNTAVSFLWGLVNVNAGAGIDLNFGSSKIVLEGEASAAAKANDPTKMDFTAAEVEVDGSSDASPSFVRPRLNAGVGLGLGPVKLDVPVIFYPASGFAFGVSALVVW